MSPVQSWSVVVESKEQEEGKGSCRFFFEFVKFGDVASSLRSDTKERKEREGGVEVVDPED